MRKRREFSKAIKVAVIKRALHPNGNIYCEKCGAQAKRFQIDHVIPDGLGGEPVLANAELICEPCYQVKNPIDTKNIARAKRREVRHLGADRTSGKIKSAPFKKSEPQRRASKPISKLAGLPPAEIFRRAK